MPRDLALDVLLTAALAIPSYDPRWPWWPAQIAAKVQRAFDEGMANPRRAWTLADEAELDEMMAGFHA